MHLLVVHDRSFLPKKHRNDPISMSSPVSENQCPDLFCILLLLIFFQFPFSNALSPSIVTRERYPGNIAEHPEGMTGRDPADYFPFFGYAEFSCSFARRNLKKSFSRSRYATFASRYSIRSLGVMCSMSHVRPLHSPDPFLRPFFLSPSHQYHSAVTILLHRARESFGSIERIMKSGKESVSKIRDGDNHSSLYRRIASFRHSGVNVMYFEEHLAT